MQSMLVIPSRRRTQFYARGFVRQESFNQAEERIDTGLILLLVNSKRSISLSLIAI